MTRTSRKNTTAAQHWFEKELRAAIESRRPVASLEFEPETLTPDDQRQWRRQAQLDEAIHAWKRSDGPATKRSTNRSSNGRTLLVSAAVVLALLGLPSHVGSLVSLESDSLEIAGPVERGADQRISAPAHATRAEGQMMARIPAAGYPELDADIAARRTRLSRRASRLVYALNPVKERVTAVMEQLIDAVPGGDLLVAWSQDT